MNNTEEMLVEVIALMEQARLKMESLRQARHAEQVDGRAISIAVTNLETAQLWVANARR